MKIIKIIPFRLASARFPDKPLRTVFGKTLVENSLTIAGKIPWGRSVLTATDEDYSRLLEHVDVRKRYDFDYIPTGSACRTATERVLELHPKLDADLYVSLPVDEPALIPGEIESALKALSDGNADVFTLYCDFFCLEDALSRLSAKIAANIDGEVLYMSRSVIPIAKYGNVDVEILKKNVGVFFFPRLFLERLKSLENIATTLDVFEGLEQLRWLELGFKIGIKKITHYGFGIDVPEQIPLLEERIQCLRTRKKSG
jgi:3-deoxy-manno-octulosonate cytidylyltransferase (CMP-KDO synthetase)